MTNYKRNFVFICILIFIFSITAFSAPEEQYQGVSVNNGLLSFKLKDADIKSVLQIFANAGRVGSGFACKKF